MWRGIVPSMLVVCVSWPGLCQKVVTDARTALGIEWRDHPERVMEALEYVYGDNVNSQIALGKLKEGESKAVSQQYDAASNYNNFWDVVITAPVAPSKVPAAQAGQDKTAKDNTPKDDRCKQAEHIIDVLYQPPDSAKYDPQIPTLRKSYRKSAVDPLGAVYLLLEVTDRTKAGEINDLRACFASDQDDKPKRVEGTKLFAYLKTVFDDNK